MNVLVIESTCDETAAAVVTDTLQVRSSVVATQDKLHEKFGGVVPEIASRAHLERILPVIDEALTRAEISLDQVDAVAVANTPGLAGSLLVGLVAAKALCVARGLPLVAVNHLQAHIYACRMAAGEEVFPCVGMIVSGGHTSLYRCRTPLEFELLGGTIDDAAGEAFDKVASLLGLPFPGGPAIEQAARNGDARAFAFPRSFIHDPDRLEFSFSGLKTAVRYAIADLQSASASIVATEAARRQSLQELKSTAISSQQVANLAASFQAAVVDCLVAKALQAVHTSGRNTLCVGGGVAANELFRQRLEQATKSRGVRLVIPPLSLCTDNAVMGAIAIERLRAGLIEPLDLDIYPGLVREKPGANNTGVPLPN